MKMGIGPAAHLREHGIEVALDEGAITSGAAACTTKKGPASRPISRP